MNIQSLFLAAVLMILPIWKATADDYTGVRITKTGGEHTDFLFDAEPVVSFSDNALVMTTTNGVVSYPLSQGLVFTFMTEATAIEASQKLSHETFKLTGNTLIAEGLEPSSSLALYDAGGILRMKTLSGSDDRAQIDLSDLATGIYVVRTSHKSFKFIKR
jgi:hypothetical protein